MMVVIEIFIRNGKQIICLDTTDALCSGELSFNFVNTYEDLFIFVSCE